MDRASLLSFVLGALLVASAIYVSRRSALLGIVVGVIGFYIALLPVTLLYFPDAPLHDVLRKVLAN
jgi:hypothetical protein